MSLVGSPKTFMLYSILETFSVSDSKLSTWSVNLVKWCHIITKHCIRLEYWPVHLWFAGWIETKERMQYGWYVKRCSSGAPVSEGLLWFAIRHNGLEAGSATGKQTERWLGERCSKLSMAPAILLALTLDGAIFELDICKVSTSSSNIWTFCLTLVLGFVIIYWLDEWSVKNLWGLESILGHLGQWSLVYELM